MNSLFLNHYTKTGDKVSIEGVDAKRLLAEQENIKAGDTIRVIFYRQFRQILRIVEISSERIEGEVVSTEHSPRGLPVSLIIAVPRPQTVKKVISFAVQAGVQGVYFVKSYNSVPSYIQSHSLRPLDIENETIKAMEQVWEVNPPEFAVLNKMTDLFDQKIPELSERYPDTLKLLAEPKSFQSMHLPGVLNGISPGHVMIGIGPEQGWAKRELESFSERGFRATHIDAREYRVEMALALILGQIKYRLDV